MGLSAGRSVQAAGRRILAFQTVCGSLQRRVQVVYDFSEKRLTVGCQSPARLHLVLARTWQVLPRELFRRLSAREGRELG
jgi:hypothetical protein